MDKDEISTLVTLIASRGGSISPRGLQHAARRYRRSAADARAALNSLASAGLAEWVERDQLRLNGHRDIAAEPPWPTASMGPVSEESSQKPSNQDTAAAPTVMSTVLPVSIEVAPTVTAVTSPATAGNITAPTDAMADEDAESPRAREGWAEASNRWIREGRRNQADAFRATVRNECLTRGMSRLAAKQYSWDATIAAFPPLDQPQPPVEPPAVEPQEPASVVAEPDNGNGHLQGLGQIPADWGRLPANAALPVEIAWVQANRLQLVEERAGAATVVHLERARSPAPSLAALGWLETSIRSYAKFVDVVAKSLAVVQDEQEQVRRERLAIGEIDDLLAETL